ncbi:xanthine dehydrogenase accessory protein XdhC [Rhodobacter veldkampii DSM 11550]|uniref:Xanthine dehydrogenase accessory protein XdhC n=1 Tax=Phaeovulum veldkampii DSM 11550 TaxID=1185920 RepID=A0A2T4JI83_9RHOB|nr:xanthine dehydrogenase accessory protein XdhC [Phaeovulum veldkampii]MBK5947351.1 xanthine dehydrogenase accessory protein XdhC [Phaeovulum veldkampii DSM 11550]PTE17572.1 xanthine dehydrogenase accessory protein XdhC [Phaeovulum veldkampii DSM 11550]TDQ60261.1 molybdenum cofactor sulfurylase [Phaeovulum veldkampii DSM 11550]
MSLCREMLVRAARRGPFVRVVIVDVKGSSPREPGAAMLVWPEATEGTIGGGALEWAAVQRARALPPGARTVERFSLGPGLGQCCAGRVTLVFEAMEVTCLAAIVGPVHARPITAAPGPMPGAVARAAGGALPRLVAGWLIEAVDPARAPVWVWGAGHVGRAVVSVLAPLPDFAVTWADIGADRFPDPVPAGVAVIAAPDLAAASAHAPCAAHHLIMTYSHALDLDLCHRLLCRGFASLGLIGSDQKRARFATRLRDLGHKSAQIQRIDCPVGDPTLGKHPQAIAVGVVAGLLRQAGAPPAARPARQSAEDSAR